MIARNSPRPPLILTDPPHSHILEYPTPYKLHNVKPTTHNILIHTKAVYPRDRYPSIIVIERIVISIQCREDGILPVNPMSSGTEERSKRLSAEDIRGRRSLEEVCRV